MALDDNRREALIKAAALARVHPGMDFDEAAILSDAAATHLLEFMRINGDFALGMLQAASYMLSGARRDQYETCFEVSRMADRAIAIAPRNPDVLRRAITIYQRLMPYPDHSENDIILTEANWEALPKQYLLE